MSLLNTKPKWAPQAIATNRGWTDPVTGEVYVSIGNLLSKLEAAGSAPVKSVEAELAEGLSQPAVVEAPEVAKVVESPKEDVKVQVSETTQVTETSDAPKRRGRPPKTQQTNEVVEQPAGVQVIGEVVEQPAGVQVIGE